MLPDDWTSSGRAPFAKMFGPAASPVMALVPPVANLVMAGALRTVAGVDNAETVPPEFIRVPVMPSFVMLFAVTNALVAAFFTVSTAEPTKKPGRAIVPAMNGPIAVSVARPLYNVENPLEIV